MSIQLNVRYKATGHFIAFTVCPSFTVLNSRISPILGCKSSAEKCNEKVASVTDIREEKSLPETASQKELTKKYSPLLGRHCYCNGLSPVRICILFLTSKGCIRATGDYRNRRKMGLVSQAQGMTSIGMVYKEVHSTVIVLTLS